MTHRIDAVVRRIRMTQRAGLNRRYVIWRHAGAALERDRIEVTLRAVTRRRMRRWWPRDDRDAEEAHARFVAARAGDGRDHRVIHLRAAERREVRRRVTGFARRAVGREMRRRHTRGFHVVVATRAVAGDVRVTEQRAGPADGGVARIALEIGLDVGRALALGLHAVVTRRTAAARFGVVELHRGRESDRRVTRFAAIGRQDVIRRLRRRTHLGADAVAGGAILRCAFENGVDVAGFAGQIAVLTGKLEARGQVIERGAIDGGGICSMHCTGQQQQCRAGGHRNKPELPCFRAKESQGEST